MSEPINRAHTLASVIGADTAADLAYALRALADDIQCGRLTTGVTGSPSVGYHYAYRHDPAMTHDAYFAMVNARIEQEKEGRAP